MAYPLKSNWATFSNPQFNRLQNQIQLETQALLRQRDNLSHNFNNKFVVQEPYLKPVQSQKYIKLNSDRNNNQSSSSKNPFTNKLQQIAQLCKRQNSALGQQIIRVLNQQKIIYNDLVNSNGQSSQKTQYFGVSNPIIQAQKQSSVVHGSRNQQISNSSSGNQSPNKITVAPKSNVRQAIQSNPKIQGGDQLIQMIQEIQRKALNQIQKLRQQKIDLMKQLKTQIQSNNQLQKQINYLSQQSQSQSQRLNNMTPYKQFSDQNQTKKAPLQEQVLKQIRIEMNNLRQQNQNLRNFANRPQQNSAYTQGPNQAVNLRQRVSILESELRNRDQLIKSLSLQVTRLNQQGGNSSNYQLSHLLQQGQSIRQNTLHLIRIKQGHPGSQGADRVGFNEQQRIRQLQQLLERQEEEKQNFLNDLLVFKQKYQQLEQQNTVLKRQSKFGSSDLNKFSPIIQKSMGQGIGASLDDYEKILSQMKGVGRY